MAGRTCADLRNDVRHARERADAFVSRQLWLVTATVALIVLLAVFATLKLVALSLATGVLGLFTGGAAVFVTNTARYWNNQYRDLLKTYLTQCKEEAVQEETLDALLG